MQSFRQYDVPFEGTSMRCYEGGAGPSILMLHGSGAGAYTVTNFRRVLEPLARRYHVLASDLIGYGRSGLRPAKPYFDMAMWQRQAEALLARLPAGEPVILVGHSLSGSIVLKLAAANPRVRGVLTTGTTGAALDVPPGAVGWQLPAGTEGVMQQLRRQVVDAALIEESDVAARLEVTERPGYRDYFREMYPHGRKYYLDQAIVPDEVLAKIACPVVLMHGLQDASFRPEETSLVLARKIARVEVLVVGPCAHGVAFEQPAAFLRAVDRLAQVSP